MECPYCHKEMRKGAIPALQDYRVRWIEGENYDPYYTAGHETVWLSEQSLLGTAYAEAWYCADCKTVIVPVREFEELGDKLKRKWNSFTEKLSEKRAASSAEQAEKRKERLREERRKKDPWEVD